MKSTEILVAACLTAATLMGATLRADDEAIILSEIADLHELAVETAFNESPQFQTELLAVIDELEDALFGELQAAFEAAGVLDDLDSFLVEGGQLGFGAYDSSGIFDPFGAGSSLGSDSPGGGGSFYGLFGRDNLATRSIVDSRIRRAIPGLPILKGRSRASQDGGRPPTRVVLNTQGASTELTEPPRLSPTTAPCFCEKRRPRPVANRGPTES